jgi:hypothetical protein
VNAVGLWVLLLSATPDDCREAYASVSYRDAARICVSVLPAAPEGELPGLYRLAALSAAAIGEDEQAYQLFVSLLAMSPAAQLEPSISPKLRSPFERAKARRRGLGLALAPTAGPARQGSPLEVRVAVEDGPERPVTRVGVRLPEGERLALRADPTRVTFVPGQAGRLALEVTGVDAFGGRLARATLELDVAPRVAPRPGWLSWKIWGVASGLLLAGALASGIASRSAFNAANSSHFASDAASQLALSRNTALVADLSLGAGGVMGGGAALLLITEPGR